jgi:hypothetical protein
MVRNSRTLIVAFNPGGRAATIRWPRFAGPQSLASLLRPLACLLLLAATPADAAPAPVTSPAADEPSTAAAHPAVRIERGRISVDVGEVPVAAILATVARDLRAEVLIRGDLGVTKAQTFTDLPLLDGLERLVQPNHLLIEFEPPRGGLSPRILRIRVFGLGAANDPSLEPETLAAAGGSAAVARTPAVGPRFDGNLGWSYEDESRLPPLAQRVRRISGIYAVSGERGMDALRLVVEADPDAAARAAAVRSAAAFPYQDALPLLQQAINDASIDVRLAAVSAINPDPTDPPMFLVDTIVNEEEDQRVRLTALERLGRFRDDEQVQDVLADIALSEDPRINQAAQALVDR